MKNNFKVNDTVTITEGRYGFKEREVSHFKHPLTGTIVAMYDRFCVVKLRTCYASPYYDQIVKGEHQEIVKQIKEEASIIETSFLIVYIL